MKYMRNKQAKFTALVNVYSADLYRYAYWLCRDRTLAEDLVQETFTRAWRSIDSLRDESAAKYWLITTLRREHARCYARKQPDRMESDIENLESTVPRYDTSIEAHVLRCALAQLSLEFREPLLLQVLWGYSCKEIATMLDMNEGAVMTRLSRARQKMRELLAGDSSREKSINTGVAKI